MAEVSLRRISHRGLLLGLLCAFVLRALIPVGFMPVVTAQGTLALEFCPAYGATPSLGAAHTHHHQLAGSPDLASENGAGSAAHQHEGHDPAGAAQHHAPCLFAASSNAAPPQTSVLQFIAVQTASTSVHNASPQPRTARRRVDQAPP